KHKLSRENYFLGVLKQSHCYHFPHSHMKIINLTKNTTLAEKAVFANNLFSRIKGLLARKEFNSPEALILKPANSVHTFFMRFPIDILFVDRKNKVIKAISNLKPFSITAIYFMSFLVIELPVGIILFTQTSKGDTLQIIP
ncbi:MAG: DUF192 domain-containing protein, partial [Candidatus Omnitrophota bacterium]|nr:DUF192 domain-containing protein [Candidatus Omnitrophota bacterium]